jgi:hypothetical protein
MRTRFLKGDRFHAPDLHMKLPNDKTMRFVSLIMLVLVASSCGIKEKRSNQRDASTREEVLLKGGEIVTLTQSELLKNVSQAMQKGGPGYAVDFCNMRAMHLKDSLSTVHNCEIRRIALKYRNPVDRPRTKLETDQLNQYQDAVQQGDTIKPEVYLFEDRMEYYHPIFITKGACLVCHGDPDTQIGEETLEMIRERYPDDLATGFAMNDFRGAWKITFHK